MVFFRDSLTLLLSVMNVSTFFFHFIYVHGFIPIIRFTHQSVSYFIDDHFEKYFILIDISTAEVDPFPSLLRKRNYKSMNSPKKFLLLLT